MMTTKNETPSEPEFIPKKLSPKGVKELEKLVSEIEDNWQATTTTNKMVGGNKIFICPNRRKINKAEKALIFLNEYELLAYFDYIYYGQKEVDFFKNPKKDYSKLDRIFLLRVLFVMTRWAHWDDDGWDQFFISGEAQPLFNRLLELEKQQE
jgi:hypothetical protein